MSERCPRCGTYVEEGDEIDHVVDGDCERIRLNREIDDLCRQLAQAKEQLQQALAREARLRRVVEDAQSAPQRAQEWMRANGLQVADPSVPMQRAVFEVYNLLVELAQQAEAALADAPAAPPAARERPERAFGKGEREC